MKKSNLIAALMVMIISAATFANAGEGRVDFDGRASGTKSFATALNAASVLSDSTDVPLPAPVIVPQSNAISHSPLSVGGCGVVCQGGINADCSCVNFWQSIWDQTGGEAGYICGEITPDSWVSMAKCGPGVNLPAVGALMQSGSKALTPATYPALQEKLHKILLSYCDKSPEFAEAILPMLKDGNAKITTHNGFVYIVNGNTIIRFGGEMPAESKKAVSSRKWGLPLAEAAANAVGAVYGAVTAWNEYSSWPPVPDSGTANNYHGPALTVDTNGLQTYHHN